MLDPKFQKNNVVRLIHDREQVGTVRDNPIATNGGWQYKILLNGKYIFFAEADLVPFDDTPPEPEPAILDDVLRHLLLTKQSHRLTDNLYALYASRTKFEVYQFKPALKFLNNPDQRLLIADEVGLGKTIEAGIIFLELQARLVGLARVLIVCPSALTSKWHDEMRSRFDEQFTITDARSIQAFFDNYKKYGVQERLKAIASLEMLRRAEFAATIAELHVHFDLVIIDEAHHCRNTDTLSNGLAFILSEHADAMLLLTATPLHTGNDNLFHLLQILNPGEFDNFEAFERRLEPNRHINRAAQLLESGQTSQALQELRRVESTHERQRYKNDPYYKQIKEILEQPTPTREELVTARRRLLDLNTLAHIFTRTRKREVQENAPVRAAYTLPVAFTPAEWNFYFSTIRYVRNQYSRVGKNAWASGFAVIMRERQVASCISAAREHFKNIIDNTYKATLEEQDITQGIVSVKDTDETFGSFSVRQEIVALKELLNAAQAIGDTDSKFQVFKEALDSIFSEEPNAKILVFSFFRDTLNYLHTRLTKLGYGVRVIHGGQNVLDRQRTIADFQEDTRPSILLSSEVGSEGLDFQFCSILFNYDLPWNPMKVEQRIGRIDRFGQPAKRIRIYNLIIQNSIEERIFLRLYERIGLFKESVGDLEAILGEEIRKLSKDVFSKELTPAEETRLAAQAERSIIQAKHSLEEFEKQRMQFLGQDAIFASEIEDTIKSGRFVSEVEIRALVESFLKKKFPRIRWEREEDDSLTFSLQPNDEIQHYLQQFIVQQRLSNQPAKDFLRRLVTEKVIPITFTSSIAFERKRVEFVTLRHPLAQAASEYWHQVDNPPLVNLAVQGINGFSGDYHFFIYSFDSYALEKTMVLLPVVIPTGSPQIDTNLSQKLLWFLQHAKPAPTSARRQQFDDIKFKDAQNIAQQYIANERNRRATELNLSNDALVAARSAAIQQTYEVKKRLVEGYLRNADDPRIKRMRKGQLEGIERNYQSMLGTLQKQRHVALSYSLEFGGLIRII